jgi:cell division protein FtsI (penicillin-binding protein 3)
MLLGVVEGGTAVKADLGSFSLAGKTGTARRTVRGSYALGQHIPTFVGLFPADRPQFVILVKIDNPKGSYFGGLTAAPVTKAVLQAALASRNAALDRGTLAASRKQSPRDSVAAKPETVIARVDTSVSEDDSSGTTPYVVTLAAPMPKAPPSRPRAVPDVHGLTLRRAVHALHTAGFRVQLMDGAPGTTLPAAGTVIPAGTTVHLAGAP